jgi:hypothetical protein
LPENEADTKHPVAGAVEADDATAPVPASVDSQDDVESAVAEKPTHPAQEGVPTDEQAAAELQEQLGTEEVAFNPYVCEVCGVEVNDTDLHELTQIRFQKYLCRTHFKEKLQSK